MAYWAIDTQLLGDALSFTIKQSTTPSVRNGDSVIFFERRDKDIIFTAHGIVSSVNVERIATLTVFGAQLARLTPLEPPRALQNFSYSLQKVYIFTVPQRHFARRYNSLTKEDFSTLVEARIFWARTAFGTYLDKLSEAALAELVVQVGTDSPRLLIDEGTFGALWKELRQFITGQYIGAHNLTSGIAAVARSLEDDIDGFLYGDLQLGDSEGIAGDPIYLQEERLQVFADSLRAGDDEQSLLRRIDEQIAANSDSELGFEELFRGTPWPTRKMPH